MKRTIVTAVAAVIAVAGLTACGSKPSQVTPNSRCSKSQKGIEVTNPDGREYECKRTGLGKRSYKWVLD